ncbi:MAG TPA: hypothetical protein VFW31_01840 [Candidatus Angelobacter sp.]|nr:hypothetical protein [Candidatus Angelobacter sp.]
MMNKREAEDNSKAAGTRDEQSQSEQILSEAERQLRIGRAIMQEYRSTLSALSKGEQEKAQD